jgi:Flp pilus assembly protein TadG
MEGRSRVSRAPGHSTRGQGLVEFALVFPIAMLVLIAIFDVGRLVFAYNDITNAARSGARTAIVDQTPGDASNATINQATSLGLTSANVDIQYLTSDLSGPCSPLQLGCVAQVTVHYAWSAITPIVGNIMGPITVTAESRMPIERMYP